MPAAPFNDPRFVPETAQHSEHHIPDVTTSYDVVIRDYLLDQWRCSLFAVRDTNALLEQIDPSSFEDDERLPYWAEVWTSSVALAERLVRTRELDGENVMEIGCGLGLAGIAAARSGATVTLTDYEEDALEFARLNVDRNLTPGERSKVALRFMDWRKPDNTIAPAFIIGADVAYERRNFLPLENLLRTHLSPTAYGLFSDPGRSIAEDFFNGIAARGFSVDAAGPYPDSRYAAVRFYTVRRTE